MFASDNALALIKRFEGLELTPYRDVAGYWTVGYGHKLSPGEIPTVITRETANLLLLDDINRTEASVEHLIIGCPITQNQIDALVSLVFNIGAHAFANSTLRELVIKGDTEGAAGEFLRWDHAAGTVRLGLYRRRRAERELFLTPDKG